MAERDPARLPRPRFRIRRSKRGSAAVSVCLGLLIGAGCVRDFVGQQGPMGEDSVPPAEESVPPAETSPAPKAPPTASSSVDPPADADPGMADPTEPAQESLPTTPIDSAPPIDSRSTTAPAAPICRRPGDDYGRVLIQGETLNRRTEQMLETAMEIYAGPADLKRVAQGSYSDALEASFGTHAGGGAVDISIRDPAKPAQRLFDEVPAMIRALRHAGFAAWFRDTDEVYPGSVPHIHAIAIGDMELSEAARLQLTGPAGYFRGFNGLPLDPPVPDTAGGPVVCPWMAGLLGLDPAADAGTDAGTDAGADAGTGDDADTGTDTDAAAGADVGPGGG